MKINYGSILGLNCGLKIEFLMSPNSRIVLNMPDKIFCFWQKLLLQWMSFSLSLNHGKKCMTGILFSKKKTNEILDTF